MVISLQSLNDDSWLLGTVNPDKPSLLQMDTVDGVLRQFTLFVMEAVDDVAAGKLSKDDLPTKLEAEAKRLQSCFYSETKDYDGNMWDTPAQLGKYLVETIKLGGEVDDAVERLFRAFCHELVPVISSYHEGKDSSDNLQMVAEELIERYRYFLLGIPLPSDYWDAD